MSTLLPYISAAVAFIAALLAVVGQPTRVWFLDAPTEDRVRSSASGGTVIIIVTVVEREVNLFMVAALENDALVHEAPAIVGCQTPSALAHTAGT